MLPEYYKPGKAETIRCRITWLSMNVQNLMQDREALAKIKEKTINLTLQLRRSCLLQKGLWLPGLCRSHSPG